MRSTIRSATWLARAGSGGGDERRDGGLLRLLVLLVVGDELGTERLRQLGTVAIERIGLQGEAPGQHIGLLAILDRRIVGHVDRLRDRAGDEGLRGGEHADMAVDREIAPAGAPARIGAIEHLVMLDLEMRRALQGHGAADMDVRRLDLGFGIAEEGQQVEARIVELFGRHFQRAGEEIGAERPSVEDEFDVEGAGERLLQRLDLLVGEAARLQARDIDAGRLRQARMADRIGLDLGDLGGPVAEHAQGFGHRAIDDLPIAAAGELLEFHQGEIRLDAGRVAIHDEADRAGRRDDAHLGIAIAVALAERERPIPGGSRMFAERLAIVAQCPQRRMIERDGQRMQVLVARRLAMGGAAMIADDPQHRARHCAHIRRRRRVRRPFRPTSHRRCRS